MFGFVMRANVLTKWVLILMKMRKLIYVVLMMVMVGVRGLTDRDIAQQLRLSPESVSEHVGAIRQKIGAANRTEAVAIALRKHLVRS